MTPLVSRLRQEVRDAEVRLHAAQTALDNHVRTCVYQWGAPVRDDIVRAGHMEPYRQSQFIQGQPPREVWVPEERAPRWKRVCSECGKEEHTTKFNETVTRAPAF